MLEEWLIATCLSKVVINKLYTPSHFVEYVHLSETEVIFTILVP